VKYILIVIISSVTLRVFPQSPLPDVISSVAEELAANESDPESAETFAALLYELSEEPVNVNSGNASELSRLFSFPDSR